MQHIVDLLLAAKRPLKFSDVAVGLCRSLNCDAPLPSATVAYIASMPRCWMSIEQQVALELCRRVCRNVGSVAF